ncbi:hypothetical protein L0668_14960 [Paraglaciecola aquimarina]|uniref:Uncharacterized protein n=1 Tax=Paraglaciecola algarum TaxID=3050085 RepID=A0ABS9DBN7_9ALTE|nr:hypothetical protein [Paraglaciecola sp. G1-23]MCF2949418.1 hypothetical protein [Paraglaciecola sp. G1-23]
MSFADKLKNTLNTLCYLILLFTVTSCGQKKDPNNEQQEQANSVEPIVEIPVTNTAKAPPEISTPPAVIVAPQPILVPPVQISKAPSSGMAKTPVTGSSSKGKTNTSGNGGTNKANYPDNTDHDAIIEAILTGGSSVEELGTAAGGVSALEFYSVVVSGSKQLKLPGNKGLLNVWIGDEQFTPQPDIDMNYAGTQIAAVGQYALVEANAPDFEVSPVSSRCLLLHPSGVDAKFNLTATKAGNFVVSATVNLFNTDDCTGPAIPKTANTLEVSVEVNEAFIDNQRRKNFEDTFWTKALEFWGALLALIFGLSLFLVRKQLKKWFGYDKSDD